MCTTGIYRGRDIVVVFLLHRGFSAWCTRAIVVPFGRVELNKIRGHPHESNTLSRQYRCSSIIVVEEDGEDSLLELSCK